MFITLVTLLVGTEFWWNYILQRGSHHVILDVLGVVLLALLAVYWAWLIGCRYPSLLVITEQGVAVGTTFFKRHMRHDSIGLVEVYREAFTIGRTAKIRLESRRRRLESGPLREHDAIEAWVALRSMNPNALARYFSSEHDQSVILPEASEHSDPFLLREALVNSLRSRRWRSGLTAAFGALVTVMSVFALIFGLLSGNSGRGVRSSIWLVLGPLAMIGAGSVFLRAHRQLRELLAIPPDVLEAQLREAQSNPGRSAHPPTHPGPPG